MFIDAKVDNTPPIAFYSSNPSRMSLSLDCFVCDGFQHRLPSKYAGYIGLGNELLSLKHQVRIRRFWV